MIKKKKRVIKVPKAVNGLEANNSLLQQPSMPTYGLDKYAKSLNTQASNINRMTQLKADIATGNPYGAQNFNSSLNKDYDMSKFSNSNSSGMGAGIAGGLMSQASNLIDVFSTPFQESTATTGGEAAVQSVADIGKGTATGAQIGMTVGGPIGGIIGGVAGAVVGAIGRKGREAEMTSFTDYDEGTLGTGFRGFKNGKLREERKRVKMNALNNRAAVAGTEYLQSEYAEENDNYNTNTYAQGGTIPSSLAYVDDGELISTPDGSVSKVPEQGKPVDSNLVSLPEGSRVLSNTLKVPGTKKTFAQLGEEMMTKRKSKGKDRFAENATKLNEMNNKQIHDALFAQQEAIKAKRGTKKEYKNLVEEFQSGGYKDALDQPFDIGNDQRYMSTLPDGSKVVRLTGDMHTRGYRNGQDILFDGIRYRIGEFIGNPFGRQNGSGKWYRVEPIIHKYSEPIGPTEIIPERVSIVPFSRPTRRTRTNTVTTTYNPSIAPVIEQPSLIEENYETEPTFIAPAARTTTVKPRTNNNNNNEDTTPRHIDWQGISSDIASLAPIMSNLFTDKPEEVLANYNPYVSAISNALSRRRYDITPAIRDLARNRAISDYNFSQSNTNTGSNMAYRLQSAIAQNNAVADIRAQENNVNNAYRSEYAQTMNNLGQQFVAANNLADDLNAQNRATARNIRRAGLSQLSGWAQNKALMNNQKERDKAMLKLYRPLLEYGFTPQDYSYLINSLR